MSNECVSWLRNIMLSFMSEVQLSSMNISHLLMLVCGESVNKSFLPMITTPAKVEFIYWPHINKMYILVITRRCYSEMRIIQMEM